jgi:hypothetical protein
MSASFENELRRELTAVGVTGRVRGRILAEFADHLACDPQASLGEPRALARQFADEVGTTRALRAALVAFAALALAGILFAVAFVTAGAAFGAAPKGGPVSGRIATAAAILFSQISFVAGMLALLRWAARRRAGVLPGAEAAVIVRRAAVGVVCGIVTMASLGAIGVAYERYLPSAWTTYAIVAAAVGLAGLVLALPPIWAAARVRPVAEGSAGDLFDDLGDVAGLVPGPLRGRPWRLAVVVSLAVGAVITLVAVPAQDALDGAARGLLDALLCMAGFATLGRYLGLWGPREPRSEAPRLTEPRSEG